eukprot:scaffold100_cov357-Prasinococcus_capsulatus_cf.AAC.11
MHHPPTPPLIPVWTGTPSSRTRPAGLRRAPARIARATVAGTVRRPCTWRKSHGGRAGMTSHGGRCRPPSAPCPYHTPTEIPSAGEDWLLVNTRTCSLREMRRAAPARSEARGMGPTRCYSPFLKDAQAFRRASSRSACCLEKCYADAYDAMSPSEAQLYKVGTHYFA